VGVLLFLSSLSSLFSIFTSSSTFLSDEGTSQISLEEVIGGRYKGQERQPSGTSASIASVESAGGGSGSSSCWE
jgi:hypothetical protein